MTTKPILLISALALCTSGGLMAAAILAIAIPFTRLWNTVPVAVFKAPLLGYWQAVGLLTLIVLAGLAADGTKISLKLRHPI